MKNLDDIKETLIIEACGYDTITLEPITKYKPSEGHEDIDLEYYIDQYILCNKLKGYLDMFDTYKNYLNPRFNIVIYSIYVFLWYFVLYCNVIPYF